MVKIISIRKFKDDVYVGTTVPKIDKEFNNRKEVSEYKNRLNDVLGRREDIEVELHYKEV